MSKSVTGGFGERVVERNVVQDSFVEGVLSNLVITRRIEYYSGSLGGPKHTGKASVVERWQNNDSRDIRDVGVAPDVYVRIRVPSVNERVLVEMPISTIVTLGEFSSKSGSFTLTDEPVNVKFDESSVTIENVGSFNRVSDVRDTMTYDSWRSQRRDMFDRGYECGTVVEGRLRKAWAKQNGVHSFVAEIAEVDDAEYTSSVTFHIDPPAESGFTYQFSFRVSMDEWDENAGLRGLVNDDGYGVPSNLEGEEVFVSMDDYSGAIASDGAWSLYQKHNRSNAVKSVWSRVRSVL